MFNMIVNETIYIIEIMVSDSSKLPNNNNILTFARIHIINVDIRIYKEILRYTYI